jgi:2-polyprenyl-3-methyl-5-hydroxy-6-metoxy-1,4-benzoquinol methylase
MPRRLITTLIKGEGRDDHDSARLLTRFLPLSAQVLDYGCGVGGFLSALKAEGFVPTGVEFDKPAARAAARNNGCPVFSVDEFRATTGLYDAIHLGDVLEHLPDPLTTLCELLATVKPGGVVFVEGPLEINPSPVYWAARLFGVVKRRLAPELVGTMPPTHLLRVDAPRQRDFSRESNRICPWCIGKSTKPAGLMRAAAL